MRWDVLFSTLNLTNFAGMLDFASMRHIGGWGEQLSTLGKDYQREHSGQYQGPVLVQLPCPKFGGKKAIERNKKELSLFCCNVCLGGIHAFLCEEKMSKNLHP